MLRCLVSLLSSAQSHRAIRLLRKSLVIASLCLLIQTTLAQPMTVLFGTHVAGPGKGFSAATFDATTGQLSKPELIAEAEAPATFILTRHNTRLYACNSTGFVSAYSVANRGRTLKLLNKVPSEGADPNYISLDATGNFLLVANYGGANVVVWQLQSNGKIGPRRSIQQFLGSGANPSRQQKAFAHSILVDPSNRFVLIGNLGLDQLIVDRFNPKDGSLTPNNPAFAAIAAGQGARLVLFHPNGRWVYLDTEIGSNIVFFHWNSSNGTLDQQQIASTLPRSFTGSSAASEIRIHPDGRFLYASNRINGGANGSVAVFSIDAETGHLTLIQSVDSGGRIPRNFEIDPTGQWMIVANQESNNAQVFRIDRNSGLLTPVGTPVSVPSPFTPRFVAH